MIVIFNGPPAAGKDEATVQFTARGYQHLSFKEVLIEETVKHYDVTMDWFMDGYDDRTVKETPMAELEGLSRREALIHVSEDIIKPKHGKEFFGLQVASKIEEGKHYGISDGGFTEEIAPIIAKVGIDKIKLVQLLRLGCSYRGDSRKYFNGNVSKEYIIDKHTEIDPDDILPEKLPLYTYRVHNNGHLSEFHKTLTNIYKAIESEL
jgi:hypothetical protein